MARERGQADTEAGRSMRSWGWNAEKSRDALRCPNCGTMIYPRAQDGEWDFSEVWVPDWGAQEVVRINVEVKAGSTSLAFSTLRKNQRLWAEETANPKWLWICLGKSIRDRKYPRKTWLLPLSVFYGLERHYLEEGRKSLPYACPALDRYALDWLGNKLWALPPDHPIRRWG